MGIPLIQEIWDGLRWLIDFFVNKVPAPIKFIIFLLLLLVFGNIFSYFLHIGGVHCNSEREVVKVDFIDVTSNLNIMKASGALLRGMSLNITEVYPDRRPEDCYYFARELSTGYFEECNITDPHVDCKYWLKDGSYGGCHDCVEDTICFDSQRVLGICGWQSVCSGDVMYSNDTGGMNCGDACYTPKYYQFNSTTGLFDCLNETYCGENSTLSFTEIDEKIERANGVLLYEASTDGDYMSLVKLKCNSDLRPRLTIVGIDVFNYKIWLLLAVIVVLFGAFYKLRTMR